MSWPSGGELARLILGRTTKLGKHRVGGGGGNGTTPGLLEQLLKRGGCFRTIKFVGVESIPFESVSRRNLFKKYPAKNPPLHSIINVN